MLKKLLPNDAKPRNGLFACITKAWPGNNLPIGGINDGDDDDCDDDDCDDDWKNDEEEEDDEEDDGDSFDGYIIAVKRSVVGSGPIRWPGKSCFNRLRINEVLPTYRWMNE